MTGKAMWITAAAFAAALAGPASAESPRRVVSTNVCTDQLAMLVAAPGQLVSVSMLARDPASSAMTSEAASYPRNHGAAEEILLMKPDLVLAGDFTTPATTAMLRRLGLSVETFAPATSLADIRAALSRLGRLLGHPERAATVIAAFDRDLAALHRSGAPRRTAAAYFPNGMTAGTGSLVADVMAAAGLRNIGGEAANASGFLPLERLVALHPDIIILGGGYDAPALADADLRHPAFLATARRGRVVAIPSAFTLCGTPFTLDAVRRLADAAAP